VGAELINADNHGANTCFSLLCQSALELISVPQWCIWRAKG